MIRAFHYCVCFRYFIYSHVLSSVMRRRPMAHRACPVHRVLRGFNAPTARQQRICCDGRHGWPRGNRRRRRQRAVRERGQELAIRSFADFNNRQLQRSWCALRIVKTRASLRNSAMHDVTLSSTRSCLGEKTLRRSITGSSEPPGVHRAHSLLSKEIIMASKKKTAKKGGAKKAAKKGGAKKAAKKGGAKKAAKKRK